MCGGRSVGGQTKHSQEQSQQGLKEKTLPRAVAGQKQNTPKQHKNRLLLPSWLLSKSKCSLTLCGVTR